MLRTNQVQVVASPGVFRYPDTAAESDAVFVQVRLGDLHLLRRLARQAPFDWVPQPAPAAPRLAVLEP